MSTGPTLIINRETREVTLIRSPLGLQGIPGEGVPDGATDGQIAVYDEPTDEWVPTTVLDGCIGIAVVDALPGVEVPGILYLSKSLP